MEAKQLATQFIQFNRTVAESTFESADLIQTQFEKMTDLYFGLNPWIPEGGRNFCVEWHKNCRSGIAALRDSVEAGLAQANQLWQLENVISPEAQSDKSDAKPGKRT
jgi:hypothetical protein